MSAQPLQLSGEMALAVDTSPLRRTAQFLSSNRHAIRVENVLEEPLDADSIQYAWALVPAGTTMLPLVTPPVQVDAVTAVQSFSFVAGVWAGVFQMPRTPSATPTPRIARARSELL